MKVSIAFAGDINLVTVTDPTVPFRKITDELKKVDLRLANLECCFFETSDPNQKPADGFHAKPVSAEALAIAGFDAVGTANNGNFGSEPIMRTIEMLDRMGIKHTGTGGNIAAARQPVIVEVKGVKVGFVQSTCVYWPFGHEAGENTPGVATTQVHTAYRLPMHRAGLHVPPLNRPGIPPEVVTWTDPSHLQRLRNEVEELRSKCDIVIASVHWGFKRDPLSYMTEIGHAAIDAGAHAVIGHGPHNPMPMEVYKGRPIYYTLSSFSFNVGHRGQKSGNWLGQMAVVSFDGGKPVEAGFRWVRHTDANETYFPDPKDETAALEDLVTRSKGLGTKYSVVNQEVRVEL